MTKKNTNTGTLFDKVSSSAIIDSMKPTTRRPNHFGTLFRPKRGNTWYARWMHNGKKYQQTTRTTNYHEALRVLDRLTMPYRMEDREQRIKFLEMELESLRKGAAQKELPIEKMWDEFEKTLWESSPRESTVKNYRNMIVPMQDWMHRHGCRYLSSVTHELAEEYLKELQQQVSTGVYTLRLYNYRRVWRVLSERNYLVKEDVWKGFKGQTVKKSEKTVKEVFTDDEVRTIFQAVEEDPDMKILVSLMNYTGMAIGDAVRAKWEWFNFETGLASYSRQKTGEPCVMPICKPLRDALLKAKERATGEYVSEANFQSGADNASKRISKLLKKLGIKTRWIDSDGREHKKSAHSFRHTVITRLIEAGYPIAKVKAMIGHTEDSEMTTGTYYHAQMQGMTLDGIFAA